MTILIFHVSQLSFLRTTEAYHCVQTWQTLRCQLLGETSVTIAWSGITRLVCGCCLEHNEIDIYGSAAGSCAILGLTSLVPCDNDRYL